MPFIPSDFVDELIARTDIVQIISGYVRFTKRTGANEFGLCPFHSEKTPSFSVDTDKQIFYCFGCHKGGTAIQFVMEIENLQFADAVEFLAKRAGLTVPVSGETQLGVSRRNRMLDLNRDAARFYYRALASPEGAPAAAYMRKRGILPKTAKRFGLGAAPDSWQSLTDAMKSQGYTHEEMIEAGLVKRGKNNGVYDTFRNRLMFPIIDVRGNVIGFSGRALGDNEPKYLNTQDTVVFSKRRGLYAINIARKSKAGMLILVEGNIDVVSLHQAGFDCAVATLGTALSPEQARLMKQYTSAVVLAYDSDDAGQRATQKAAGILENAGVSPRVLRFDGAKDPDEYIQKYGADSLRLLLDKCENHIEYRLRDIYDKSDKTTDEGRIEYLKQAVALLSGIDGTAEREVYGRKVADNAGVSYNAVDNEVRRTIRSRIKSMKKQRETIRPQASIQPADRSLRYENEASAKAEQGVIICLVHDPEGFETVRELGFLKDEFTSPLLGKIYDTLLSRDGAPVTVSALAAELEPVEASELIRILSETPPAESAKALADYISRIRALKARNAEDINAALLAVQKSKQRKVRG